jgi:hypothetical protein
VNGPASASRRSRFIHAAAADSLGALGRPSTSRSPAHARRGPLADGRPSALLSRRRQPVRARPARRCPRLGALCPPAQLIARLGLAATLSRSGEILRCEGITKAGSRRARRLLAKLARRDTRPSRFGVNSDRRQAGRCTSRRSRGFGLKISNCSRGERASCRPARVCRHHEQKAGLPIQLRRPAFFAFRTDDEAEEPDRSPSRRLPHLLLRLVGPSRTIAAQNPVLMMLSLLGVGIGSGLSVTPTTAAAVEAVQPRQAGLASGVRSTSRTIGLALGVSAMGALMAMRGPTDRTGIPAGFASGLSDGLPILGVLAGATAVLALATVRDVKLTPEELPADAPPEARTLSDRRRRGLLTAPRRRRSTKSIKPQGFPRGSRLFRERRWRTTRTAPRLPGRWRRPRRGRRRNPTKAR